MNIAIDFDETIDRDPDTWSDVVGVLTGAGHDVFVVTNNWAGTRPDIDEFASACNIDVYYAQHQQKEACMGSRGVHVDVWIDDTPNSIPRYDRSI